MHISRPLPPLIGLALLCGLAVGAMAGELAPGLSRQLDLLDDSDEIRVLVVLTEQVDAPELARQLRLAKASGAEVHREVVTALRETADRGQADLLADLGVAKSASGIRSYHPHWLINAVVVTGRVDAIRELARRPDVARIEPDLMVEGAEPVATGAAAKAGQGMGAGIGAIGADRVWRELGIDGTGVVMGIIDSGVDGSHPALAGSWRGNFAPPAECWLDAAELGDTEYPVDRRYHGTHVAGIMVGLAPGDTIGVAPGALWIGSNALNHPGDNDAFDNAILASLEFMADPDGDPATSDDVPAVVNNSWGVTSAFEGYFDCDSRWWDAIDACEAAGVVLVWSVGNEGPGSGTIRSPADRAATPTNCFSVGSTATVLPFQVSSFSSRGPSACGGENEIKPEVVGPGEEILSAEPGGGYIELSGTSMAGPHVAGVVALMRQANPDADVETIKQVLMDTAMDRGFPGEDNDYGHGLVDAYAAVTAIKSGVGTISGLVIDQDTLQPLVGALVQRTGSLVMDVTDSDGYFLITLPAGPTTFDVTAFGYEDGQLTVTVPDGDSIAGGVTLVALPTVTIGGRVVDEAGTPLVGATVTALDTPLPVAVSDGAGEYELPVPLVPGANWMLRAAAAGYGAQDRTVAAPAPVVVDFDLSPLTLEDFETGDFSNYPWRHLGDTPWVIDAAEVWRGQYSARSGALADGRTSEMQVSHEAIEEGSVTFHLRVSSEHGYDQLRFFVDDVLRESWSGEVAWTRFSTPVGAGLHTYRWVYAKDAAGFGGADAVWIDDVEFPPPAASPVPVADIWPNPVSIAAVPGGSNERVLVIANPGQAGLDFVLGGLDPGQALARSTVTHLVLAKGEPDPRTGDAVLTAGGGPDGEGRLWTDSDQDGGPVYDWVDIGGTGTDLDAGDDEVLGPYALGFSFPWQGATYDEVHVGSNGFLTFTPSEPAHTNQGIPDPALPNAMLAAFWDDLDPSLGGRVLVSAEPGLFIVQFDAVAHFGDSAVTETFQVLLHDDGTVVFQYREVGAAGSCTVGMENAAGDDGLQVLFNCAGYLRDELAIRFAPAEVPAWLTADVTAGTVPAGGESEIRLMFDAAGLGVGNYETVLHVATTDPSAPLVSVPVTLFVDDLAGDEPELPRTVAFTGAAPNPFNPMTHFGFSLPRDMRVRLRVYDVAGRLVRVLADESMGPGRHRIPWDGRDGNGREAASGVYFVRMEAENFSRTRSAVLVR